MAQLRVSDIQFGESPAVSINSDGIDKKVKNESSARMVPLSCIAVGLLSSLLEFRGGSQRLFPELTYSEANGYASKPSKFFSQLSKQLFGEANVSFHSFRHFAITHLFNSGVKEELIGSLVGHSVGNLTTGKVYLSGFTDMKRYEAIETLDVIYSSLDT